jgi:hypothetical protein
MKLDFKDHDGDPEPCCDGASMSVGKQFLLAVGTLLFLAWLLYEFGGTR